jgi:hypothetical protein
MGRRAGERGRRRGERGSGEMREEKRRERRGEESGPEEQQEDERQGEWLQRSQSGDLAIAGTAGHAIALQQGGSGTLRKRRAKAIFAACGRAV